MSEMSGQKQVWTNGQWYSPNALWGTCARCGKQITMGEAAYGDAEGRIPRGFTVTKPGRQDFCGACAEKTRGVREVAARRAPKGRDGALEGAGHARGATAEEAARDGGVTELLVGAFTAILIACASVRVWMELARETRDSTH